MELSKNQYNEIQSLIESLLKDSKNNEFEVRLCSKNFKNDLKMDFYKFEYILNHLIFENQYGGYGFKYEMTTTLDIKFKNDIRLSILDKESVKLFWLTGTLKNKDIKYEFYKKSKKQNVDISDYNLRFSLSEEILLKDDSSEVKEAIKMLSDNDIEKNFRMKNRYLVKTPEELFRFDLTSIKMVNAVNFKKSGIFTSNVDYEVELEYSGEDRIGTPGKEKLVKNLMKYVYLLLKLYHQTPNVMKNKNITSVINNYKELTNIRNNNTSRQFITVNPVTFKKKNLVKKYQPNILNDYAVTLKADGVRHLMLIIKSSDKTIDGKIVFIDSGMNVIDTGLKNEEHKGSLIEGEYLVEQDLFLCYDILFDKGNDVRDLPLIETKLTDKKKSRLGYLSVIISKIRQTMNMEQKEMMDTKEKLNQKGGVFASGLIIQVKDYKSGGDIFDNIRNLWENRHNYEYGVDGLVFTPTLESYPKKGGTWNKLLKWKPAEYNSFDFLIKVKKDNRGRDIKTPYTIYRENGENQVYQYKTLELYVGKTEVVGGKKKYSPSLFNPLNQDREKAEKINNAKIVLNRNGRMIATDPGTGQQSEIMDDTIVEFVYDRKDRNFPWKPIRIRHDKTGKYKSGQNVFGNDYKTANSIWEDVSDPLTYEILILGEITDMEMKPGEIEGNIGNVGSESIINKTNNSYYECKTYDPAQRMAFQNFHNLIVKMNLIKEVSKEGGKLLDLACGKAGDLSKWTRAKFKDIVSIDIDKKCLEYALEYYADYKAPNGLKKPKVNFIWGDTSKLIFPKYEAGLNLEARQELREQIPAKNMFDVVSSQFCLHYYFESEEKLRTFLQNVSDNVKIGGYFIGTCFDGLRIKKLLERKKEVEGKIDNNLIWKIEKQYKGAVLNSKRSQFGKSIDVYVKSINNKHREYLVDFRFLEKILGEYGFEKVKVMEFADIYRDVEARSDNQAQASKMTDVEKEFSFLNNAFIFKKI